MTCPQCQSKKSVFLHSEGARCCANCGTMLDEEPFVYEDNPKDVQHTVFTTSKRTKRQRSEPAFVKYLQDVAVYYKMPEDLIQRAITICETHLGTKINSKYKNEAAISVLFIASGSVWNNTWSLYDFAKHFFAPVDIKRAYVIYTQIMRQTPLARSINSKTPQEEAENLLSQIYPTLLKDIILKEDYVKLKKSKNGQSTLHCLMPLDELRQTTSALIDLGDLYLLNTGKHSRPIVIATAFIAGLSIYVKYRTSSIDKLSRTRKKVKLAINSVCPSKKFEHYREYFREGTYSIRTRINEYMGLLFSCTQQLPWLKNEDTCNYVHYHLDDILQWFGNQNYGPKSEDNGGKQQQQQQQQRSPLMRLEDDSFVLRPMRLSNERDEARNQLLAKVNELIEAKKAPPAPVTEDEKSTLLWCIFKLRCAGIREQDILNYTDGAIRLQAASLEFRENFNESLSIGDSSIDLDNEHISQSDMKDEEVELYLK